MALHFGAVYQPGGLDNWDACQAMALQLSAQGIPAKAVRYGTPPSYFLTTKVLTEDHLSTADRAKARHFLAYNGDKWVVSDKDEILALRQSVRTRPELLEYYFPEACEEERLSVLELLAKLGDDINELGSQIQRILSKYVGPFDCVETLMNL